MIQQGSFEEGLKEGEWINWFTNGNIASIYSYKNGFRDGDFSKFYPDGELSYRGAYKNDELHGKIFHFMQDGGDTVYFYKNGEQIVPNINEPDSLQSSKRGLWQQLFGKKEIETDSL